jgi:hypothetical protein
LKASVFKAARTYSLIVMLVFALKLYALVEYNVVASLVERLPNSELFTALAVPRSIAVWHVAAFLSAAITWITFFVADYLVAQWKLGATFPTRRFDTFIRTAFILRNVLTSYVILCAGYVTVQTVGRIDLPPLETKFFPWP